MPRGAEEAIKGAKRQAHLTRRRTGTGGRAGVARVAPPLPHEAAGPAAGRPRRRAAGAGNAEAAGVRERGAERGAAGRAEPRHLEPARAGVRGAPGARHHDPLLLQWGAAGRRLGRAAALQAGHGLPRRLGHGRPPGRPPAPRRLPLRVRCSARHRSRLRAQPHR